MQDSEPAARWSVFGHAPSHLPLTCFFSGCGCRVCESASLVLLLLPLQCRTICSRKDLLFRGHCEFHKPFDSSDFLGRVILPLGGLVAQPAVVFLKGLLATIT